jgi:hypothetical protein
VSSAFEIFRQPRFPELERNFGLNRMRQTLAIFLLMLAGIGNACAGWLWDSAEEAAEQKRQDIVSAQTHIDSLRRVQNILYRLGVASAQPI